jgi:hypothetical protein
MKKDEACCLPFLAARALSLVFFFTCVSSFTMRWDRVAEEEWEKKGADKRARCSHILLPPPPPHEDCVVGMATSDHAHFRGAPTVTNAHTQTHWKVVCFGTLPLGVGGVNWP